MNLKKSNKTIQILLLAVSIFLILESSKIYAYDVTQSRPSVINNLGHNIESSTTIGRHTYRLGLDYTYIAKDKNNTLLGPNDTQILNLKGAYGIGINDSLTVGLSAFSTENLSSNLNSTGIGDLEVGYYHRLSLEGLRNSWSFGLVATIPTSVNPDYFGSSHAIFKAPIIFTRNTYNKIINLQLTPIYRQSDLIGNYPVSSGIGWGAGVGLNMLPKINAFVEINGEHGLKKESLNNFGQFSIGISTKGINSNWLLKAGISKDLYRANTNKQNKFFISLNFDFNRKTQVNKKILALDCMPSVPENIVLEWPELPKKVIVLNFDKVHFDTDKHSIKPEYYSILDKVVNTLQEHPEIKKLRITGHTDSRMNYSYNVALSQRRSKSVYRYLINSGVSPDRLVYEAIGYIHPKDGSTTTEGLAANRRVDFQVIEVSDKGLKIDRSYRKKRDYEKSN